MQGKFEAKVLHDAVNKIPRTISGKENKKYVNIIII
jgi:hypothetical protein